MIKYQYFVNVIVRLLMMLTRALLCVVPSTSEVMLK